jgi:hypothetical protein
MQCGDNVTAEVVYKRYRNCMELCVAGLERATGLALDGKDTDVTVKEVPTGPDYTLLAGAASTIESDDCSEYTPVGLQAAS